MMISFRLNAKELALLKDKVSEGESPSLAAKRLLLDCLGAGDKDIPPDNDVVRLLISESIKEGDIGAALDKQYRQLVGYINDLRAVVDTCKQDVDNSVDIPVDNSVDIPVDTCKQDVDKTKLVSLLGLEDILSGDLYNAESLKKDGYFKAIADNKAQIAEISGIEVKMSEDLTDMNAIIKWLGLSSIRTTHNKISYRRVTGKL